MPRRSAQASTSEACSASSLGHPKCRNTRLLNSRKASIGTSLVSVQIMVTPSSSTEHRIDKIPLHLGSILRSHAANRIDGDKSTPQGGVVSPLLANLVSGRDNPPGDEAECDAPEKPEL